MKTSEINELITSRMLAALEQGVAPWQKPWSADTGGVPRSMSTGKGYRGINTFLLGMTAYDEGFTSPWWGTFNVIKKLGGHLRKGSHGTKVYWWKIVVKPNPDNPEEPMKFYIGGQDTVFCASQCDNLPDKYYPDLDSSEPDILPEPQAVIDDYLSRGPSMVRAAQGRAYYTPDDDQITMPMRSQFSDSAAEIAVQFHECAHSTGHKSRLNRPGITDWSGFGSHGYGVEELCAEASSAVLAAMTGVETESTWENSVAYLDNWIHAIKADAKLVPAAFRAAQAAVDLITGQSADDDQDQDQDSSERSLVAA